MAVIDCGLKRASQSLIPSSRCLRPFPPWVRFHTGHCPPSTVHCPGHTPPAPREQPKIDRLACPTPDSLQKPSWKATSAPRNDLVSAILRPWPGTLSLPVIPCLPLPLCVVGSLSVVHPSESQGHPIANHRPPRFPNIRPTTRSPTTPRAAFLPKIRRTRSVVTRHPSPRPGQPPSPHLPRHDAAGCFAIYTVPRPINRSRGSSRSSFFYPRQPRRQPLANPFKHQPAPDHPRRVSLPSLAALCGS